VKSTEFIPLLNLTSFAVADSAMLVYGISIIVINVNIRRIILTMVPNINYPIMKQPNWMSTSTDNHIADLLAT
jgi:hypothetical protein